METQLLFGETQDQSWMWGCLHHRACVSENPELALRVAKEVDLIITRTVRREKSKEESSLVPISCHPRTPPPAPGNHWPTFHTNGIPRRAAFCVWLLSLSVAFPRSICIVGVVPHPTSSPSNIPPSAWTPFCFYPFMT